MSSTSTRWCPGSHFVFAFIFFVFALPACAQVVQLDRYEISLAKEEKDFEVIPSRSEGLFLHRRLGGQKEDRIEIIQLDTAFNTNWHGYLPVDKKFILVGKRAEPDHLYLLLRYQEYHRKDLELIAIERENGNFIKYTVRNFIPFVPTEFQVTPYAAVIGGYYNNIPVIIYFSFATQKTKMLPGLLNEAGELTQIQTYADGHFDVLISARNFSGQRTIWIKNYDPEGNILKNYALEPDGNRHLIFARSIKTSNEMQIVAGVYGGKNSEYSKGIFMASIDPSGLQHIKYYDYGDLGNFFKYMKARREQRVKDRIERRKIKGKRTRFNYRFLVHELVPHNNQYVLLGEAFYPRYVSVDRTYYSGFFNPYMLYGNTIRDGRIFDGYRYTHAVVMGFDRNGRLLWDNSFEINDVKSYSLEQFVKLEIQQDRIALLYLFENELRSKIIKGNEVLEGKMFEPIRPLSGNEVVKNERTDSKLDYWYEHYFFAHGVQEIADPKTGKRRVFYINKISSR